MTNKIPQIHIVNLFGGTGNLLFQLAHAHKICSTRSRVWVFLIEPSARGAGHKFEIKQLISHCDHLVLLNSFSSSLLRSILFFKNHLQFRQRFFSFWRKKANPNMLFSIHNDYYQDLESLTNVDSLFLEELNAFLNNYPVKNQFEFHVALHVRAGDYYSHLQTYGVLTEKYYRDCLKLIPSVPNERSAIFYDTPSPALLTLSSSNEFMLLGPDSANSLDLISSLRLSRYCVIANSTLSWWGGLLAISNGARVFVPKPWHKTLESDFDEANQRLGFELVESSYL